MRAARRVREGARGRRPAEIPAPRPRAYLTGSGAEWAAHLAADIWTITATAAQHDIEPLTLLTDYLQACAQPAAPRRPGPTWTPSCPGHPKDAPAVAPQVISARAPARNLPISPHPAKHPTPLPSHDAESHFVMPSGRQTRSPTGSPITYPERRPSCVSFPFRPRPVKSCLHVRGRQSRRRGHLGLAEHAGIRPRPAQPAGQAVPAGIHPGSLRRGDAGRGEELPGKWGPRGGHAAGSAEEAGREMELVQAPLYLSGKVSDTVRADQDRR